MPQANAFDATPTVNTIPRGVGSVLRILPAAVVILAACGLLATAAFDRSAATEAPRPIPAQSAPAVAVAAGDTSVPDASTVFSSHEFEIEVPIPTF